LRDLELNALTSERLKVSQMRTELEEKLQVVLRKLLEAEYFFCFGRQRSLTRPLTPGKMRFKAEINSLARSSRSEKTAKECIQHLRDQRAGQATFIPLETIQVKAFNTWLSPDRHKQ
jgi:structural maintenance of chromosome 1